MTKSWLGVSVSALALACAGLSARAGEVGGPVVDASSTPSLFSSSVPSRVSTPAALLLGIGAIFDASPLPAAAAAPNASPLTGAAPSPGASSPDVDGIVTGQIAKPDAEGVLENDTAPAEAEPVSAEPVPVPASLEPGTSAPADAGVEHDAAEPGSEAAPAVAAEPAAAPVDAHGAQPETAAHAESGAHDAADFVQTRGPAPFDIIRTIQFLQDQVARGNGRAIRVQAVLLRRFGPVFLAADGNVWKDERNRRAAVLFVLSGGPPEVLSRLLQSGQLENDPEALFQGALSYVQNDLAKAQRLLSTVDLSGMEPGLAAHIHLVLGQMQQLKDPDAAIRNLDQARLLAPGGLIEEAALRMEVLIAEDKGEHEAADRLARQYFDRYARSSYSANFEARFAAVYAGRKAEDPQTSVDTILDVTERLAPDSRRGLLLAVARRALVDGKLRLAELASDAAGAIEGIPDADRQRAELYATAARLGTASTSDASALLGTIRRDELHPEDAKLLDAANSVIASIERPFDGPDAPGEDGDAAESSPVFARAEKLMNDVSDDLEKVQK